MLISCGSIIAYLLVPWCTLTFVCSRIWCSWFPGIVLLGFPCMKIVGTLDMLFSSSTSTLNYFSFPELLPLLPLSGWQNDFPVSLIYNLFCLSACQHHVLPPSGGTLHIVVSLTPASWVIVFGNFLCPFTGLQHKCLIRLIPLRRNSTGY